ncbi:MAG TPA: asparagine synthase-related protein, partial [Candidatus Binatus sp.]|nr:asparagine synthase-related protein [Candidatus Binatus sp.]
MTGICGIVGPDSPETSRLLEQILDGLGVRGVARRIVTRHASGRLFAVGICERSPVISDGLVSNGNITVSLDGYFVDDALERFADSNLNETERAVAELSRHNGAHAMLAVGHDELVASRDPLGQKPLYNVSDPDSSIIAFASLKTSLEILEIGEPLPFPPGRVISVGKGPASVNDDNHLENPEPQSLGVEVAVESLGSLLVESVNRSVPDSGVGIAFSGGLDSTLVAQASILAKKKVELFTVGLEGQAELSHAEKVADEIGLPLTTRELTKREVIDLVPDVVEITETSDPIIV